MLARAASKPTQICVTNRFYRFLLIDATQILIFLISAREILL